MILQKAVFLDRDGVIVYDNNHPYKLEQLRLIKDSAKAIKLLNQAGFKVIIITNQAGIAKGIFNEKDLEIFHHELQKRLKRNGAKIDKIYYCPHHPEGTIIN